VHFADRDAFLAAVMERIGMPFLDAVLGATGDASVSLQQAMERFLGAVASGAYPLTHQASSRASHRRVPIAAGPRRYVGHIEEAISRLVDRGARARPG
jgi:AcrR family transcriptional regulator